MNSNNATNFWGQLRIFLLALVMVFPLQKILAAGNPEKTRELIAILRSDADLREKSRACKDAGVVGTAEIVPVLAGLLEDEKLAAYARGSLEIIPNEAAREALRAALGRVHGKYLAGAINSLGNLRDEKSAPVLRKLAADPNEVVATQAIMALGQLADPESLQVLREMLKTGPQTEAALACLMAAQRQLQLGNATQARELCDEILASKAPLAQQVAAVRGSIVARGDQAGPFLLEQLKSANPALRNAALVAAREIPSKTAGIALKEAFKNAQPAERQVLLQALADCDPPSAADVARANLNAEDSGLRTAALKAFSRSVGPSDAATLIAALGNTPEEAAIASEGLARLDGINSKILTELEVNANPKVRVLLIELLADRHATEAKTRLLQLAADPQKSVSLAAGRALRVLAGPEDLSALITLVKTMPEGSARAVVGIAVASAARQRGGTAYDQILVEFNAAHDLGLKEDWGAILISVGYQPFLSIVQSLLQGSDTALADSLILKLGRWPNSAPVEILLPQLSASDPGRVRRALTAIVELAIASIENKRQPASEIIALFGKVQKSVKSVEEKRLFISGVGNLAQSEAIKMLEPYLDDKEVQGEAAIAILAMAGKMRAREAAGVLPLLQRIVKETDNQSARATAGKLVQHLQPFAVVASASQPDIPVKPDGWVPLFDGKTLAGWEGNTAVWRAEDGAIKGGSMSGNPRNEFLVTTRPYKDFVFELEYQLVGTEGFVNGGVQFRSARKPPTEMIGYQADLGSGYTGCLYDESRRGILVRLAPEPTKKLEGTPGWTKLQIRCLGSRIQLFYNGQCTADYTETKPGIPDEGIFGLQIHGGNKAVVSYRNIRIQELSPATAH